MSTLKIQLGTIVLALAGGAVAFILALNAPSDFPEGKRFEIGENESLYSISERLEQENIITSAMIFRGWVSLLRMDTSIGLGAYVFERKVPLGVVVAKIANGPDEPLLSVTIPEGSTTDQIALSFSKVIPTFGIERFISLVRENGYEGYLFPSTYYPLPSNTEQEIMERMKKTFDREIVKRFEERELPPNVKSMREVVSLAAILEGEANTKEDMRMVSGILQERLKRNMRLQVDVAEITYKETGIPIRPISNPGLMAIEAVYDPTHSQYLYYLTGRDGRMYYAKTYDEHKRNINRYLR